MLYITNVLNYFVQSLEYSSETV